MTLKTNAIAHSLTKYQLPKGNAVAVLKTIN